MIEPPVPELEESRSPIPLEDTQSADTVGACRDCGATLYRVPGKRGRPPVKCDACRAADAESKEKAAADRIVAAAKRDDREAAYQERRAAYRAEMAERSAQLERERANRPPGGSTLVISLGFDSSSGEITMTEERMSASERRSRSVAPVRASAVHWKRSTEPRDWVAVDLETTGLNPSTDRIVEIALVRFDPQGRELDAWTTLLDPMRDMGATQIHGITARDVLGAPRFRDAAPEIAGRMSGARLVAHNARFDLGFLVREFERTDIDWGDPDAFCTMTVPYELGLVENRRLVACCQELGIPLQHEHTALGDARATGHILLMTMQRTRSRLEDYLPAIAPDFPPAAAVAVCLRGKPAPLIESSLGALADRIGVPEGLRIDDATALSYLDLLDRVLEDRRLTEEEVADLTSAAREWGISASTATDLHRAYLAGIGELALADGVITAAERADLARLSELLGVAPARAGSVPAVRHHGRSEDLAGKSVCFTGTSVCTIDGVLLSREDQERLATEAGLIIKSGVSGKLDILVLADPDSQSGKARKAEELGVRRLAEPTFWRILGVAID